MQNTKTLKIIAGVLSGSILVLFGTYYFLYQNIKTKNISISQLQKELLHQSERQSYFTSTELRLKNLVGEIDHIKMTIVPKGGEVGFIEEIEALARENGLDIDISSIVVLAPDSKENIDVETLKIKANTEGPWLGNYKLLKQIENLNTKVKIDRYALVKKNKHDAFADYIPGTPVVWESSFEISALRYK